MLSLFISSVYAQEAAAAGAQNPIMSFVPLIVIFFIFYFLMIRPQKKKLDEEQKFLDALQKGQEVYTKSGLIGTVYGLTDRVVTLEIADGARVKFLRSSIGGAASDVLEPKTQGQTAAKKA